MIESQPANALPLDPELARFLEQCREQIVGNDLPAPDAKSHGRSDPARTSMIRLRLFHAVLECPWMVWFLGGTSLRTNMHDLERHVSLAIRQPGLAAGSSCGDPPPADAALFDRLIGQLLTSAGREAARLDRSSVRLEHFLLALLAAPGYLLDDILRKHDLHHLSVVTRMWTILSKHTGISDRVRPRRPDPAVGVPRRFGLSILFLLTVLYAFLFAGMKAFRVPTVHIWMIVTFLSVVGVAQAVLFGGEQPRKASLWAGGVLLPVMIMGYMGVRESPWVIAERLAPTLVLGIPLGAFFGYLAGAVAAGAFCVIEEWKKCRREQPASEGEKSQA